MSRLFFSKREIDFVSDITKEFIKDVVGESIFYFSISEAKSDIHEVYEEAINKIFENPIEIKCLITVPDNELRTGKLGIENFATIEAFVHKRDLLDKNIIISEGDFFSYRAQFFEIVGIFTLDAIFGQGEHETGIKIVGKEARKGQFSTQFPDGSPVQLDFDFDARADFKQERGFEEVDAEKTGDVRELQKREVLEKPITGPKEVSSLGTTTKANDSFYDED